MSKFRFLTPFWRENSREIGFGNRFPINENHVPFPNSGKIVKQLRANLRDNNRGKQKVLFSPFFAFFLDFLLLLFFDSKAPAKKANKL